MGGCAPNIAVNNPRFYVCLWDVLLLITCMSLLLLQLDVYLVRIHLLTVALFVCVHWTRRAGTHRDRLCACCTLQVVAYSAILCGFVFQIIICSAYGGLLDLLFDDTVR